MAPFCRAASCRAASCRAARTAAGVVVCVPCNSGIEIFPSLFGELLLLGYLLVVLQWVKVKVNVVKQIAREVGLIEVVAMVVGAVGWLGVLGWCARTRCCTAICV